MFPVLAMTGTGDGIAASARVVEKLAIGDERYVQHGINAREQTGVAKTSSSTAIALV